MNNIRQSLAISICCFGINFVVNRQFRNFFITVFFATLFHYSALLFIVLYPLNRSIFTYKKTFFIICLSLTIYVVMGLSILQHIMAITKFKYDSDALLENKSSGWSLLFMYSAIFIIELFIYTYRRRRINEDEKKAFTLCLTLQMMASLCQIYAPLYSSMTRLALYFYIPIVISVPYIINSFNIKIRPFLTFIVLLYCCLFMVIMVYAYSTDVGSNSQGVIPYVLLNEKLY